MGRDHHYKPGSFYRQCDRTGFAVRSERTQMEWNGLIVDKAVWEQRHPQDFVKGVFDDQVAPYARPRTPNPAVGTSLTAQFEVYGDRPTGPTFEVQSGQIGVFKASTIVTASSFPKSF